MKKAVITSKGFSNQSITSAFLNLLTLETDQVRVAIITTAAVELKEKHPRVIQAKEQFHNMGILHVDVIDVEKEDPVLLAQYHVVYLTGGNPFYLLSHMKKSGADKVVKRIANEGVILIGVSAGSLVLGPHLKIVHHLTPQLMQNIDLSSLYALKIVNFPMMPHYDREDLFPGSRSIEKRIIEYETKSGDDVFRLKDDDALVVTNEEIKLISLPNQ
ncbi:peptidase [Bacillus sp. BGMRC 2118]|nr:peptidase [Bacillus sp. BGMRC 2118]